MMVPHKDVPENIRLFHELFEKLSGSKFTLDFCRMDAWRIFINYRRDEPFTHDDLRLVWRFLRKQIINGKRNAGALKFRNLIMNPDYFEEDLAEAMGDYERSSKPLPPKTKTVSYGETNRIVPDDGLTVKVFNAKDFFAQVRASLNGHQPAP